MWRKKFIPRFHFYDKILCLPHNAAAIKEEPMRRHDHLAIELLHLPHKAAGVEEPMRHDHLASELFHLPHKAAGVELKSSHCPRRRRICIDAKVLDRLLDGSPFDFLALRQGV